LSINNSIGDLNIIIRFKNSENEEKYKWRVGDIIVIVLGVSSCSLTSKLDVHQ